MDFDHRLVPTSPVGGALAAAGVAGVLTVASLGVRTVVRRVLVNRRYARVHRDGTGGCTPDVGYFIDADLVVRDVDGSNQGIAIAILRDTFLSPDGQPEGSDEPAPFEIEYDSALRSLVEVGLVLALELAEHEVEVIHDCGDDECHGNGEVDPEMVLIQTLVAGRKLIELAMGYEKFADEHAQECRVCHKEGARAPAYMRAQFCRDLSDDVLTNFDNDHVEMHGVPIAAATDVVEALVTINEKAHGVPVADQIARLTENVAAALAHKENHGHGHALD